MKTAGQIPKGAKAGRPANLYFNLFKEVKASDAGSRGDAVLVKTYKDRQGAYQARKLIVEGKRKIPGGVRGWEIVARRVPSGQVKVDGVKSELWAQLKVKK